MLYDKKYRQPVCGIMDSSSQPPSNLLEFENVSFHLDGHPVLRDLSLVLKEDENVAILGPNGSGKSTLIRAIIREVYPVVTGRSYTNIIRGREIWNVFELRSLFGVVSGDLQARFNQEITGRDVILSGFFSSIGLFHHTVTTHMEEQAERIAQFLCISHLLSRSMRNMSSGEARRCLIGRALVHDPEILILDEPTTSLDLHALHLLRSSMRTVAQGRKMVILVTHSLPDIIPEITRVICMKDGNIVASGKKEDVLTDRQMSDLFDIPVRIHHDGGYYYATGY